MTTKPKALPKLRNPKAVARIALAPPLTGKRKPLKAREQRFVEIWAGCDGTMSATEVAKQAGYPVSYAHVMGSKLTNPEIFPNVVAAIQRRQAELNAKHGTTFERHMKDLLMIRDKAIEAGAWSDAVQAEYRRGQALGQIYIDRKEIRHGTIDSMSKEEVQRKLEALRKIYQASPNILDVEDAHVVDSIEMEKEVDHTEEFIDETGSEALSEDEDGDDEDEDHPR